MQSHSTTILVALLLSLAFSCPAAEKHSDVSDKLARDYVQSVKNNTQHNALLQRDAVPDKDSAIGLAVVVWQSIYGKEQIEKQKPYQAIRVDDCWYVTGSLPRGWIGGTAEAVIRVHDGSFLNVSHGK